MLAIRTHHHARRTPFLACCALAVACDLFGGPKTSVPSTAQASQLDKLLPGVWERMAAEHADMNLIWLASWSTEWAITRTADGAPLRRGARFYFAYEVADHCFIDSAAYEQEHLGGGAYGELALVKVAEDSGDEIACDAVQSSSIGYRGSVAPKPT